MGMMVWSCILEFATYLDGWLVLCFIIYYGCSNVMTGMIQSGYGQALFFKLVGKIPTTLPLFVFLFVFLIDKVFDPSLSLLSSSLLLPLPLPVYWVNVQHVCWCGVFVVCRDSPFYKKSLQKVVIWYDVPLKKPKKSSKLMIW